MQLNGSMALNKNFLEIFDQWVVDSGISHLPNAESYIHSVRRQTKHLHGTKISGSTLEITSIRVIRTVKAIACRVLQDCPEKLAKVAQMKIWYGLSSACRLNKDGNLEIKLDPRDFLGDRPLAGIIEALEKELQEDPSFMNFIVAHEVAHFKLQSDGYLRETVAKIDHYLKCLKKIYEKNDSDLESYQNRWYLREQAANRFIEYRADKIALQSVGSSHLAIKLNNLFPLKDFDPSNSHPLSEERIRLAKKYQKVPTFIPEIEISYMDTFQEFVYVQIGNLNDRMKQCCRRIISD